MYGSNNAIKIVVCTRTTYVAVAAFFQSIRNLEGQTLGAAGCLPWPLSLLLVLLVEVVGHDGRVLTVAVVSLMTD